MNDFRFFIKNTYKKARCGVLHTAHGVINTPVFMPVGTNATVKGIKLEDIKNIGSQIILSNTYHLMLRPGIEAIKEFDGLHKFSSCDLPILTDSGGFQVMSLSNLTKITSEGVVFKSHIDGKKHFLSPKLSTEIQYYLGSDISMVFDICLASKKSYLDFVDSVNITTNWAEICRKSFNARRGYGQFGIVQGGVYKDLRKKSALEIKNYSFEGYAVGGLAVGEKQNTMLDIVDYTTDFLPFNKPRYLMGVGKPSDIINAVQRGIDMFDCVLPTRSARNAQAFTNVGTKNVTNAKYRFSKEKLDESCNCFVCSNHYLGYLHHLFKCKEMLGAMMLTHHNICYFHNLMKRIQDYIVNQKSFDFYY